MNQELNSKQNIIKRFERVSILSFNNDGLKIKI